jgi:periplasmic protein TonB
VRTSVLVVASLVLHVGGFTFISKKAKQVEKRQTLIAMVEQKKKEEEKKKEPPPKPIEAPKEVLQPKAVAPPPVAPPPPSEPVVNDAPSKAMQAMPDYGLNLGGGGGGGTLAVPENKGGQPGGTAKTEPKPAEKVLNTPPPSTGSPDLAAEIAAWKPKPTARVKPVYPDEARSSEIEGTVTVEAIIDCSGKVSSAKVLAGLGHGLDQAAITAIQKTEFEPAPRCVPGFQKAMKINYAFRLGD